MKEMIDWRPDPGSASDPARRPRGLRRLFRPAPRSDRRRVRLRSGLTLLIVAAAAVGSYRWFRPAGPAEPGVLRRIEGFALPDAAGRIRTPDDWQGSRAVVLYFLGTECPASNGYAPEMERLAREFGPRGVAFCGIHGDPDVTAEAAREHARAYSLGFPVLLDPYQELADQLGATVTPEAALLDAQGNLVYRGRIDDRYARGVRRRPAPTDRDLQDAIEAVLSGSAPDEPETEAVGCPLPPARAAEPGEEVVYSKHVAPILATRCAGCHRPGEVGPFPLLSYRDAARRADFLRDITAERRMPPWKPRHGFGEFLDEARLSRRELAVLAAWAATGAPEGDPADLPPPREFPEGWQLGEPDLVVQLPEPYEVPAGQDIYRAFVLPLPLEADRGIAAAEFRPGNRRVVHHARIYVDSAGDCRVRDRRNPGPGFPTLGGNDIPKPTMSVWIPGATPRRPPPGVGHVLKAGSDLVLLLHYHGSGKPEADRSSVGLYFADGPIRRSMCNIPLSTARIDIPPGEDRHRIELTATLPASVHAYSVLPHGHFLLREMKLWAALPDGTTRRLLWIDDWDFNWQGQYHFAQPVALPRGTRLHVAATYDNSSGNPFNPSTPPVRVRFGPASTDEMLGCHVSVLPDGPEDERIVRAKWADNL